MLSHSYISMLQDPRSLGELKQGVTLQIFGEGHSMGPLTPEHARAHAARTSPTTTCRSTSRGTSLAEYLAHAEKFGVSQNVASYIGATTLRIYAVGHDDRPATAAELDTMRGLVRDEMSAGALGIGSSLIYPPAFFASTEELIELCSAAAPYGGKYISHMRSEGDAAHRSGRRADAHQPRGRRAGRDLSPEGGRHATTGTRWTTSSRWSRRRAPPASRSPPTCTSTPPARPASRTRSRRGTTTAARASSSSASTIPRSVRRSATTIERLDDDGWENLYGRVGGAENVLILGVRKEENRQYQGKTLAQVARDDGRRSDRRAHGPRRRDRSRVATAYFMMSEDNVRKEVAAPVGVVRLRLAVDARPRARSSSSSTHPRAYGNFARLLGQYVRDEQLVSLPEAIRRLTRLPRDNLGI